MSDLHDSIIQFVEKNRAQCLWFLRPDYLPTTDADRRRVLDLIERYGDRAAYVRAEELKSWLSPDSKATSSSS